jgi:hypothetical protein
VIFLSSILSNMQNELSVGSGKPQKDKAQECNYKHCAKQQDWEMNEGRCGRMSVKWWEWMGGDKEVTMEVMVKGKQRIF